MASTDTDQLADYVTAIRRWGVLVDAKLTCGLSVLEQAEFEALDAALDRAEVVLFPHSTKFLQDLATSYGLKYPQDEEDDRS